jgi:hypothetical protein
MRVISKPDFLRAGTSEVAIFPAPATATVLNGLKI